MNTKQTLEQAFHAQKETLSLGPFTVGWKAALASVIPLTPRLTDEELREALRQGMLACNYAIVEEDIANLFRLIREAESKHGEGGAIQVPYLRDLDLFAERLNKAGWLSTRDGQWKGADTLRRELVEAIATIPHPQEQKEVSSEGRICPECGTAIMVSGFGAHHSADCKYQGHNFNHITSPDPQQQKGTSGDGLTEKLALLVWRAESMLTFDEFWDVILQDRAATEARVREECKTQVDSIMERLNKSNDESTARYIIAQGLEDELDQARATITDLEAAISRNDELYSDLATEKDWVTQDAANKEEEIVRLQNLLKASVQISWETAPGWATGVVLYFCIGHEASEEYSTSGRHLKHVAYIPRPTPVKLTAEEMAEAWIAHKAVDKPGMVTGFEGSDLLLKELLSGKTMKQLMDEAGLDLYRGTK